MKGCELGFHKYIDVILTNILIFISMSILSERFSFLWHIIDGRIHVLTSKTRVVRC